MGHKMSYHFRDDLIIRFHVNQGREKASFLDYLENVPKQRKKQVQKPKCGSMPDHVAGITRKSVWLE